MSAAAGRTAFETELAEVRGRVLSQVHAIRPPTHSRRFRVLRAVAVAAAAATALTAGAIVVIRASPHEISGSVVCYEDSSRSSAPVTVLAPTPTSLSGVPQPTSAIDPVEACEGMWRMGLIGQAEIPVDPNAANLPVPDLVGCAQSNGVGIAFPRKDLVGSDERVCAGLGLQVWEPPTAR